MTETPDRIERTLEVLLYAPIGIGLFLKDTAPSFVDMFISRGRAEVDRRQEEVQQRVTTARSLGQVALAFGPPVVRKRVEQTVAEARERVGEMFGSSAPSTASPAAAGVADATTVPEPEPAPASAPMTAGGGAPDTTDRGEVTVDAPNSNGDLASSAGLPIPGYDALSASQVVQRLTGLAPEELDAVHEYEASHRQRRTILGKIEQLAG
jgi:hypothetical protein